MSNFNAATPPEPAGKVTLRETAVPSKSDAFSKTAVIIGAGPAGLTAAYELLTRSTHIRPVILEAGEAIGGISRTACYKGNRMDIGGHRFFSKSPEVNQLWREIFPLQSAPALDDRLTGRMPPLDPAGADPADADQVFLTRRRVSRIYFLKRFFDYPVSLSWQTVANLGLVRTFQAGCSYLKAMVVKRPERSLEDFMVNRFGVVLYRLFFKDYTEKVWGRSPENISADWGKQRIKGLSLSKAILSALKKPFSKGKEVETSLIEEFLYPKLGPGQLWEALAQKVTDLGGEIIPRSRVTAIRSEGNRIRSVSTQDGREYPCDLLFSTMAISDLVRASKDVPPAVREDALALPYRDFVTVGLLVKKLAIANTTKIKTMGGLVPDCWIYIQEREVRLGRLQVFNNWSPYLVDQPEETVWLGLEYFCNEGDQLWTLPDDKMIALGIDELCQIGILERDKVLDATVLRVPKAYPAYFGSYSRFPAIRQWLDGFENLYCIGRNGQHRYNNMDHSMLTAIRAVDAVEGSCPRSAVWEVNTEEAYHEEK